MDDRRTPFSTQWYAAARQHIRRTRLPRAMLAVLRGWCAKLPREEMLRIAMVVALVLLSFLMVGPQRFTPVPASAIHQSDLLFNVPPRIAPEVPLISHDRIDVQRGMENGPLSWPTPTPTPES